MHTLNGTASIIGDIAKMGLLSYSAYASQNMLLNKPSSAVQTVPTYTVASTGEIRQPQFAMGPHVKSPDQATYINTNYMQPQPVYINGQILPISDFQNFIQNNQLLIWSAGGILVSLFLYMLLRR